MKWYVIDKEYVNFLRSIDMKVEKIDYTDKIKPYIGIILNIDNHKYYVPISSVKKKHYKIKNKIDLYKIENNGTILGVLNINNMIPVNERYIKQLKYKDIEKYRKFNSFLEKKNYVQLLDKELRVINENKIKIYENAKKLYELVDKYPFSKLSKRTCNFKMLEKASLDYIKTKKEE